MLILISEFRLSIRRSLISEIIKLDEKRRRCGGVGRLNTPLSLPRDLFTQRENSSIRLDQRVLREKGKNISLIDFHLKSFCFRARREKLSVIYDRKFPKAASARDSKTKSCFCLRRGRDHKTIFSTRPGTRHVKSCFHT